jgi:hypothetical protein
VAHQSTSEVDVVPLTLQSTIRVHNGAQFSWLVSFAPTYTIAHPLLLISDVSHVTKCGPASFQQRNCVGMLVFDFIILGIQW